MWFNTMYPYIWVGERTSKKLAQFENWIEFQNIFSNLVNLALDRFYFDDLPDTCNERYFKLCLIFTGRAAIAKDKELGYVSLGISADAQELTLYGEWDRVNVYGANGFTRSYKAYVYGSDNTDAEAIICRDNDLEYPLINYIILSATRLAKTMRTMDLTASKLKTPYFITCAKSQVETVERILDDIENFKSPVVGDKNIDPKQFEVLPTNVREAALEVLWNHYYNLQTESRTSLGIPSIPNRGKKERMIAAEVEADDGISSCNLAYRMHSYEKFCDTVNEYFGLSISVRFEDGDEFSIRGLSDQEEVFDTDGAGSGEV